MKKVIVQVEFQVHDDVDPQQLARAVDDGLDIIASRDDVFDDVRTWDATVIDQ